MSNVSNRHDVVPFVSGESKPLTGQRLARVGYKATKENPNPPKSICVSVPFLGEEDITKNLAALIPHISRMLEDAQDKVIRSLYEGSDHSLDVVTDSDITVSACIAYLERESQGSRLNADTIKSWFTQNLEENLTTLVADKLGFTELTEDNIATVEKHVKKYQELFCSLASGRTQLATKVLASLKFALELAESTDAVGEKLSARIKQMETATKVELVDLL